MIMKNAFFIVLATVLVFGCKNKTTQPNPNIVPITVTSPERGATLTDQTYITAVPGNGYIFRHVDFVIDDSLVFSDSTIPYSYFWNIFIYQIGSTHSISVTGFTSDSSYTVGPFNVRVQFSTGFLSLSRYQPNSQHAIGVASYGNLLFISNGEVGLEMLDVTNRLSPQFLARFSTSGQALRSAINYPYVYAADRDQGVDQVDFSRGDSLISRNHFSTQSLAIDLAVSPHFLIVADNDALDVVSLSNLQGLSRTSFSQDQLNYVVARNDTAFIVGYNSFYIVDCTSPNTPEIIGTYNNLSIGRGVAVIDTFAFIANSSDGVIALSISHPTSPRFLARFNTNLIMTSVVAGNLTLFAGTNSGLIYAIDYGTAGSLTEIDNYSTGNYVEELQTQGYYLYAAARTNVEILRFVP
jgi:hypothetical protein